ncbi:MAG TPA: YafY family protein [Ktedonobacteraceae bacterium]|nr:YafY family protein [Ktedonobacteraceae bacterium]
MYFPATRVLTVLELLQSRHQMSGPELAERLEVDQRTVRRYIMMLQDLGIPIEAVRGRYGFYRLRPGFKLPPMMFTDEEAFALTVGLVAARGLGLAGAAPAVEGALAKIGRVLPLSLQEHVKAVQETLIFNYPFPGIAPGGKVVVTLCMAILQGRRVWLRYRAWKDIETEREVDLYGIVCRSGYWYAAGYCHLRCDLRTFRLDRIVQAEMRAETFERPADFDCVEHVNRSLATMPATWLVEVLLEIPLEQARQRVSPALGTLEQVPEGVILRCYAADLDWIPRLLVGLGCPLVVLQPPELRDALRKLAEEVRVIADRVR